MAASPKLTPLVHHAFATGLDTMFLAAAGFGVVAAIAVFTLVRKAPAGTGAPPAAATAAESAAASASAEVVA
jgi:sugar phosphate permease